MGGCDRKASAREFRRSHWIFEKGSLQQCHLRLRHERRPSSILPYSSRLEAWTGLELFQIAVVSPDPAGTSGLAGGSHRYSLAQGLADARSLWQQGEARKIWGRVGFNIPSAAMPPMQVTARQILRVSGHDDDDDDDLVTGWSSLAYLYINTEYMPGRRDGRARTPFLDIPPSLASAEPFSYISRSPQWSEWTCSLHHS